MEFVTWNDGCDPGSRTVKEALFEYPSDECDGWQDAEVWHFIRTDKYFVIPFLKKETIETTGAGETFGACALNYVLEHGTRRFERGAAL